LGYTRLLLKQTNNTLIKYVASLVPSHVLVGQAYNGGGNGGGCTNNTTSRFPPLDDLGAQVATWKNDCAQAGGVASGGGSGGSVGIINYALINSGLAPSQLVIENDGINSGAGSIPPWMGTYNGVNYQANSVQIFQQAQAQGANYATEATMLTGSTFTPKVLQVQPPDLTQSGGAATTATINTWLQGN
jgi:hypothetical protein